MTQGCYQNSNELLPITLAQLGCGYWGPNLLRNFSAQPVSSVKWVAEPSADRRQFVESNFPHTVTTPHWQDVLCDSEVDAVIVATPAATHAEIALACLDARKHVFVEKPLAMCTDEAEQIYAKAIAVDRTVMVGHTFLFNPAVHYIKRLKDDGELGDLHYIYSQRLNLGQVRTDVNAWWNLAPHDVSILLYLMEGELPVSVTGHGLNYLQNGIEDVTFAVLRWSGGVAAHIHVSWLDPNKVRKMTLVGTRKMAVYDDVSEDKVAVLDKGFDIVPRIGDRMDFDKAPSTAINRRWGDIWLPKIDSQEPLRLEAAHFLECLRQASEPITGLQHARDTVAVLEAVDRSMRAGGKEVRPQSRERPLAA